MEIEKGKVENVVIQSLIELSNFKDKKVFVTGHTGFKGAWLLATLNELGAKVKGYALPPVDEEAIYTIISGESLCESVIGDIRNAKKLNEEILKFEPHYIFHLAAQPLVRQSYLDPAETYDVNVLGTAYLLDAVKHLPGTCQVVIITTDKVYKNKERNTAYVESDELGGYDPYSNSKACVELLVESYRSSFFNKGTYDKHKKSLVTARAGNVIGGGDFAKDRIIPDLVRSLNFGQELVLRNPTAIRPWQHVIEPIIGYLQLALCLEHAPLNYSTSYNFGPLPNDHLTVEELTIEAIRIWSEGTYRILLQDDLHETKILKLNIQLAEKELNWQPKYNAIEAIQKTLLWYKAEDKIKITREQVREYLNLK